MNENSKKVIDFAYEKNIADMQTAIEDAMKDKILAAFEYKKQEIAQNLMDTNEAHCCDKDKLSAKQKKEMDVDDDEYIDEKDLEALRKKKLKKEEVEDLEEKLSASMGVDKYIHDFVHSDNPKFEGKSKKERIQMALGAYYSAKKGKTKNEEVEGLQELSSKSLVSYRNKAMDDISRNKDMVKSAEDAAERMKDDRVGDWKSMKKTAEKSKDKIKKRYKGIKLASKKLDD